MPQKVSLLLLIIVTGAVFFFPFLGAVNLFDWDEINFAESAREMIASGNYTMVQINYQPFREKPPLFFWMQAISMHVFGISEFAARLPNAITGIITLLTFYCIGKKFFSDRFGIIWALCMFGSFLPHLYFKSGIIDPVFNYFVFMGIFWLMLLTSKHSLTNHSKYAALAGIFIGLATLTKGPVALLILLLCAGIYWITLRFRPFLKIKEVLIFIFFFSVTAGIWFVIDVWENGTGFVGAFISYQLELLTRPVAGHSGAWYYHFVVVFIGCFPMSVLALPALFKKYSDEHPIDMRRWMLILFWVVMILFTLVKTKIIHYSSLTYFPLSFLAAIVIDDAWQYRKIISKWLLILVAIIGGIFSLLLSAAPWLAQHKELLVPYLNDPFALDCLGTEVHWSGYESFIGIAYLLCILLAVSLLWNKKVKHGSVLLFGATAVCMLIYLKAVVPKIESYSQGPAIRFYESLQAQNVYVTPIGFKSYAHYYYFQKPPGDDPQSNSEEWLLHGKLDRPAYFVVKSTSMNRMNEYSDIRLIRKEGGFAFYVREPTP
ncbi:MAG: glycosyltransferase family 39 protein [Chitinophagales bacterium]